MRSRELRQQLAGLVAQGQEIQAKAVVTPEEDARFDSIMTEADALRARIVKVDSLEAQALELATVRDQTRQETDVSVDKQEFDAKREKSLLRAWLTGNFANVTAEDRAAISQRQNAFQNAGSVGTAGAGGYTVPPAFQTELLIAQKAFGGMRGVSRSLPTERGQDLPWPTMDDTSNVATIVGENTTGVAGTDLAFTNKTLKAWMYRSGYLVISYELIQDSAFDFDSLIRDALAIRFARGQNAHFTATGDGTTGPQAIITGAASGKVGLTGQTTSVIYDDLVDLQHSVDPAYRAGAAWMMKDSTVQALRKLKDSTGRPLLWDNLDDLADGSVVQPVLLGSPVQVNQDMPAMAVSAKSILFGNFSNYIIRDVWGLHIQRLNELFATNGQVGFIAFQRCDGRLVSAASPVKYYQNSAT